MRPIELLNTKWCNGCERYREWALFGRDANRASGHSHRCRDCIYIDGCQRAAGPGRPRDKLKFRKWYEANRERVIAKSRRYKLSKIYGLTPEGLEAFVSAHGKRCGICGTAAELGRDGLHIDHCHETGRLRGLLCRPCNTGLGLYRDEPDLLRSAVAYLERDRKR